MFKVCIKIISSLLVVVLISCGSNQTDVADKQLGTGISPVTKSAEFGKPTSSAEIVALSKKLGNYFNGQYASKPQALMGVEADAKVSTTAQLATSQTVAVTNIPKDIFRFYNKNTGAHFFTMSVSERDYIQNTFPFFSYEGSKFLAYPDPDPALSPVYRFYNKITATHFFTISAAEKDHVIATWPAIFNYEGIAWYASTVNSLSGAYLVPVYRFFNSHTGTHFYTASASEKENIIATWNWFLFEGIAYYVLKDAPPPNNEFSFIANVSDGYYERTECVKDNATGLIWEGKPLDGSRKWNNVYTNYDSTTEPQIKVGSGSAVAPTQTQIDAAANSIGYKNAVNASNLCGASNWRLPTKDELLTLVRAKSNVYPYTTIDNYWFPNTDPWVYATSTAVANFANQVWGVYFNYGDARDTDDRTGCCIVGEGYQHIRLVR